MEAEELHGIFQFADFEEEVKPKKAIEIDRSYCPKQASAGYFNSREPVSERFKTRTGAKDVLMSIEYLYFKKEYVECLEMCEQWLAENKLLKRQLNAAELLETAARCCLKLNDPFRAMEFCLQVKPNHGQEVGSQFLSGQAFRLNRRWNSSVTCFRQYLDARLDDYLVWVELGQLFLDVHELDERLVCFASLAMQKAISISSLNHTYVKGKFKDAAHQKVIRPLLEQLDKLGTFNTTDINQTALQALELDTENIDWLVNQLTI